jgi:hypothetical protein
VASEETKPHLFLMRVWVDPAHPPARVSRGLIEHVPSGEHRYFRNLDEIEAFVTSRLAPPVAEERESDAE